jgi:hypothetical protein
MARLLGRGWKIKLISRLENISDQTGGAGGKLH